MKKYVWIVFFTILFLGCNVNNFYAMNEESTRIEVIEHEDVTGDGEVDTVSIMESIVKENKKEIIKEFLQLEIAGKRKPVTIPLSAGEPWLSIADINNDGVKDVFVTVLSEDKEDKMQAYSYTFKNNTKKNLSVPPYAEATGKLLENYTAELKLLNQVHIIDLKTSKKELEQSGVYKKGKLLKSAELAVSEYLQLKPIITKTGKGIRAVQRVKGPLPNKMLGEIVTVWYYREGKWLLQDIDYMSNYKKMYHYIEMMD